MQNKSFVSKVAIVLVLALSLSACGNDKNPVQIVNNEYGRCGVTKIDQSKNQFWYSCDLKREDLSTIKDATNVQFQKEQLCDVYYGKNGQPKQFRCTEKPIQFQEYFASNITFYGKWSCTGLDGFNGYDQEKVSQLMFRQDGSYEITLTTKESTDSIWHVSDSIISGTYKTDYINKIRLSPEKWTSDIINKTEFTLEDAPQDMMVRPVIFEIDLLSKNFLSVNSKFEDSTDINLSVIGCERVKED